MNLKLLALGASALASTIICAAPAQAVTISPAYEYTEAGTLNDSRPFTLGFSFSLSSARTVNALGYTTVGFGSNQDVGIWDAGGNLLASTTVSTSDPVVGHFAWASIPNLALAAGTYVIGGTYNGGPFPSGAAGVTSAPGYSWITDLQAFGSGLNFPTVSTGGGYGQNGIPQVNFSLAGAVPEPAGWALMIGGFGLMGGALRLRARKTLAVG